MALEAEEDLAVREQRILVEAELAVDRANVGDTDVQAVRYHCIAGLEVVQLLELGADVGACDHPVGWTTEGGAVNDVGNFQRLVPQGDVAVGEVDRCTGCSAEVVGCTDAGGDDQVVDDFAVDFSNHFVGHQVRQHAFGIDVVNGLEILGGFEAEAGLQLAGLSGHRIAVQAEANLWLEWIGFEVVLVVDAGDRTNWEVTGQQGDLESTGAVVEEGGVWRAGVD